MRRGRSSEPAHENSFIRDARRGIVKHDDLLEKVRVQRLRALIDQAGLRVVHEHLSVSGTVRRLPRALGRRLRDSPATQDYLAEQHRVSAGADLGLRSSGGPHRTPAGPATHGPVIDDLIS